MFIYTEDVAESHRNTQNINIQPKIHQKHENTFSSKSKFHYILLFFQKYIFFKNKFKQTRFMPMCMAFFIWQFKPRVGWFPAACVYIEIQKPKITKFTKIPKYELWNLYDTKIKV